MNKIKSGDTIIDNRSYEYFVMSNISVRTVVDLTGLEALSGAWNKLLQKSGDTNSLFLTYEWVSAVCRHFGNNILLNIVVIEKDHQPIGIFPLKKVIYRLGFLKFHVLETIGTQNDNLVGFFPEENQEEVINALMTYLSGELKNSNHIVKLELVPDDCSFVRLLREKMPQFSADLVHMENTVTLAPYIDINTRWEQYFKSLSKNRRKRLRRVLKHAESNHDIEYGQFRSDMINAGLDRLFELHTRRWKLLNIRSPFMETEMRQFYHEVAAGFDESGWLHFTYLKIDGNISSLIFAVNYNCKLYSFTIARDLDFSGLNLGHLHHYYLIKEAFDKRLTEFDFLRGDELHKFHWTHQWRKYQRLIIAGAAHSSGSNIRFKNILLRLSEIIRNRHSPGEILGLLYYQGKNKKLVKKVVLR